MHRVTLLIALTASLQSVLVVFAEPVADPLAELQGEWQALEYSDSGGAMPKAVVDHLKVHIEKDDFSYTLPMLNDPTKLSPLTVAFTISFDPKQPNAIDAQVKMGPLKNEWRHGIYELKGDVLRICIPYSPTAEKPKSFAVPKGAPAGAMTMKRIRKSDTAVVGEVAPSPSIAGRSPGS